MDSTKLETDSENATKILIKELEDLHKGHESMHLEILAIFFLVALVAQFLLVHWKKWHYRSYHMGTLLGIWIIPIVLAFMHSNWRFVTIWLFFTLISIMVVRKALEKPTKGTTPRIVYKWFYFVHLFSYILGIISYSLIITGLCGFYLIFNIRVEAWMDTAFLITFYGLYYGVLGQDVAELCTESMACQIGYYSAEGLPSRHLEQDICAVCGNRVLVSPNEEGTIENTYKLNCSHVFHEFCIRGWCIVGKKQICPYCRENVDLKRMFRNPWEKPHMIYGQLLDFVRWMLAWQPIIIFITQIINTTIGLK